MWRIIPDGALVFVGDSLKANDAAWKYENSRPAGRMARTLLFRLSDCELMQLAALLSDVVEGRHKPQFYGLSASLGLGFAA